jgi:hypothetical protein
MGEFGHAPFDPDALAQRVLEKILEQMNGRGRNAMLTRYRNLTLAQLVAMDPEKDLDIPGVGTASVEQLKQILKSHNLFFGISADDLRRKLPLIVSLLDKK